MLLTASRAKLSSWLAAFVVVAALISAAQFNGPETRFLAAAMTLVIVWLVSAFLRTYEDGLRKEKPKKPAASKKVASVEKKKPVKIQKKQDKVVVASLDYNITNSSLSEASEQGVVERKLRTLPPAGEAEEPIVRACKTCNKTARMRDQSNYALPLPPIRSTLKHGNYWPDC